MIELACLPILLTLCVAELEQQLEGAAQSATHSRATCRVDTYASTRPGIPLRFLLNDPQVGADIGLKEEQQKRVAQLTAEYAGELRKIRSLVVDGRSVSRDEQRRNAAKFAARQRDIRRRFETKFAALLTHHQRARIFQIDIQLASVGALRRKDVLATIDLNQTQMSQLTALHQEIQKEASGLYGRRRSRELTGAKFQAELAKLREAGLKKALTLLSRKQRKRFDELRGQRIHFTTASLQLRLRVPTVNTSNESSFRNPKPQSPRP